MLNILHNFYSPICLTLLLFLGLACGHLLDVVLQVNLHPDFEIQTTTAKNTASISQKTSEADLNLILQNNIFDAKNRSASIVMGPSPGISATDPSSKKVAQTDLKLLGTVVADEFSLALLADKKDIKIYHLNDELPGGGTLEEVKRNQVKIRNRDQSLTTLMLREQAPDSSVGRNSPRENSSSPKQGLDSQGTIREVGENRWVVSSNMVESVRDNFAEQMRLAQMQPRLVNGKTDGFLIRRIYPTSILAKMGLQRNDVVLDVNNIKLDSPEKAMQVFQQLREARQISIAVERNRQPMSFVYEIE